MISLLWKHFFVYMIMLSVETAFMYVDYVQPSYPVWKAVDWI